MRSAASPPRLVSAALAVVLVALAAAPLRAQTAEARLENNRKQLLQIRQQRETLQRRMHQLQSSAHSLTDEIQNLNRQHDATVEMVQSLDQQLGFINDAVAEASASLVRAEDESAAKQAVLRHRLIEIYERGPLYDVAALLSADSFGELVARYKYLHDIALHDRALVQHVEALKQTILNRRRELVSLQGDVKQNRAEKAQEVTRLRALERQRRGRLTRVQADTRRTQQRLAAVRRSESRLNNIIASIETERRRARSRAGITTRSRSSISTADYGRLDWPVEGTILYNYGRVVNPNNTLTRWNGVGIAAAAGTPVHAVAAGEVVLAAPLGTYGQTVILQHGGGDYSVYGSLGRVSVTKGERVAKGAVLGTVGTSDPELPPHLHFEIRHGGPAVNPTSWLRAH